MAAGDMLFAICCKILRKHLFQVDLGHTLRSCLMCTCKVGACRRLQNVKQWGITGGVGVGRIFIC